MFETFWNISNVVSLMSYVSIKISGTFFGNVGNTFSNKLKKRGCFGWRIYISVAGVRQHREEYLLLCCRRSWPGMQKARYRIEAALTGRAVALNGRQPPHKQKREIMRE